MFTSLGFFSFPHPPSLFPPKSVCLTESRSQISCTCRLLFLLPAAWRMRALSRQREAFPLVCVQEETGGEEGADYVNILKTLELRKGLQGFFQHFSLNETFSACTFLLLPLKPHGLEPLEPTNKLQSLKLKKPSRAFNNVCSALR